MPIKKVEYGDNLTAKKLRAFKSYFKTNCHAFDGDLTVELNRTIGKRSSDYKKTGLYFYKVRMLIDILNFLHRNNFLDERKASEWVNKKLINLDNK